MINNDMRDYNYFLLGDYDEYGQRTLTDKPQGAIKMAIYVLTQTVSDTSPYSEASYIGLTNSDINDAYIVQYGEEKLKVLYIQPRGTLKQVFLQSTSAR